MGPPVCAAICAAMASFQVSVCPASSTACRNALASVLTAFALFSLVALSTDVSLNNFDVALRNVDSMSKTDTRHAASKTDSMALAFFAFVICSLNIFEVISGQFATYPWICCTEAEGPNFRAIRHSPPFLSNKTEVCA